LVALLIRIIVHRQARQARLDGDGANCAVIAGRFQDTGNGFVSGPPHLKARKDTPPGSKYDVPAAPCLKPGLKSPAAVLPAINMPTARRFTLAGFL
jgi:hypothetical protein